MFDFLKTFPRLIWTIWSMFILLVILLLFFPILFLLILIGQKRTALYIPQIVSKIALFLFGIFFKIEGASQIDFNQQSIYISNHTSNLDPLIICSQTPANAKFLAKAEVLSYPIFGYALKHLYVSVSRNSKEDRLRSLRDMRLALEAGDSLIIYPEGTRNLGPELLKKFHKGAFLLSMEMDVPIVMLTCTNSWDLLPTDSLLLKPGILKGHWDGPFLAEEGESRDDFLWRVRDCMEARLL